MKKQKDQKWEVEAAMEVMGQLREALGKDVAPLSVEERKRFASSRYGFERFADLLEQAAKEAEIAIPGHPLGEMRAHVEEAQKLLVLRTQIALALESVDERIGGERGAAYKTFLAYYHVLNTLGLDAMIAPINEFFAPVKKPKAKETPSEDGPAPKVANADIEEPKDNPTKVETPVKVPA